MKRRFFFSFLLSLLASIFHFIPLSFSPFGFVLCLVSFFFLFFFETQVIQLKRMSLFGSQLCILKSLKLSTEK